MVLSEKITDVLNTLYHPPLSIIDKIIPFIIIFAAGVFTIVYIIKIDLSTSNLNWEKNKCIPKYMFVSGFIKKEKGLGALASTQQNFKKCINEYINKGALNPYVKPPSEKKTGKRNHPLNIGV